MKKLGIVFGVATVAVLSGCKNPDYARSGSIAPRNDVKVVPTTEAPKPAPVVVVKSCTCAPGTKHTSPCKCGAADCRCVVELPKPAPVVVAEPEYTMYTVQSGDYLAKISKRFNVTIAALRKFNPSMKKDVVRVGQKLKIPGKVDVGVQPVSAPVKASKKTSAKSKAYTSYKGATREYVVKAGDSLGQIAYGNGINIRQLKELNALKSDRLSVGQKLKIPASKVVAASGTKKETPAVAKKAVEPTKVAVVTPAPAPAAPAPAPAPESTTDNVAPAASEATAPAPAADAATETAAAPEKTYVVQEGDDMTGVSIRWAVSAAAIRELNNLGENDQLKPGQIIKLPADAAQQ